MFRVTVPEGRSVIANGRLVSQETSGGKSTFTWEELDPMTTYLATVDTGYWIQKSGTTPGGVPETVAVDPVLLNGQPNAVDFFFDTSAQATDYLATQFGPYPFGSTGAIADNATYQGRALGFSLETQTRPVYSAVRSSTTIAHELAHQWFGDSVSVADGTTRGSTRASRPSRSTSGSTTSARAPRSSRSTRTTRGARAPRSGASSWPIRSATRCSRPRSTAGAR